MVTVQIKVCGITNLADARYCAALGADYLGFIQHEESPRYVEPSTAQEIIEWVAGPRPVGVFVDAPADSVNEKAAATGFELIQLHGSESPEYCARIERPVIKAIRVRPDDTADGLLETMLDYAPHISSFLLDTYVEGLAGGTGQTFSWEIAALAARELPVFLAGGLNPSNVRDAIRTVGPVAVDVSSGVEDAPGRKSFEALDALFGVLRSQQTSSSDVV